jgi:serine/threonine protein kinase
MAQPDKPGLKPGTRIAYYHVVDCIGEGGFGSVWRVYSKDEGKFFALKLEPKAARSQALAFEARVLKAIQGSQRFPRFILEGEDDSNSGGHYLVEELLGPNLIMILTNLTGTLICPPYLPRLADEMLSCIQDFHRFGYIHRDIKPDNFVIRLNGEIPICLIDYGTAKLYQAQGNVITAREHTRAPGTPLYSSPNLARHMELSRKDDLISWIYTIVTISGNVLPWARLGNPDEIAKSKDQNSLMELCAVLSPSFQPIAEHITALEYASVPNYEMMHELLRRDMPSTGQPFEWMEIRVDGFGPEGRWDPTGFLMSISPFLQVKKGCLLL